MVKNDIFGEGSQILISLLDSDRPYLTQPSLVNRCHITNKSDSSPKILLYKN